VDARTTYEQGCARTERQVRANEMRAKGIGLARIGVVLAAIVLIGAIVWAPLPSAAWSLLALLVAAFVALVVIHARVYAAKERSAAAHSFHQRGLDRLDGRWTAFPSTGERLRPATHPYVEDLDIFGRASLFQLLDMTQTQFGEGCLVGWLLETKRGPEWRDALVARQRAVKDLVPRVEFREKLATVGVLLGENKPDPRAFLDWAQGKSSLRSGGLLQTVGIALPLLAIGAFALEAPLHLPRFAWAAVVGVELLVGMALRGQTAAPLGAVSSLERTLAGYAEMFGAIESERLESPLLLDLKERLRASGTDVTRETARLARIVAFVEARLNEVFRIFIAPVLLWDVNCALALDRWRSRTGGATRGWFEALGEIEALASIAAFAFDRPDHAWPEFVTEPRFEALTLGHPLIGASRRVCNDVVLDGPGTALVVTGSNMSGKSTLLRSMGVNAVLALAGAPVCATRLSIGPVTVATSMRLRDSLEEGVSHFYAELQKLKCVVDLSRARPGVFFLLDEILHGTNSRERLIGARAIVRELLRHGALGAVSTHDLAISDLATELTGRVRNVHFEEQVSSDDRMTFDYKLRDGIVQSSNALRLMKIVGIDVVRDAPPD
jgi:hypothetical protein